MQGEACMFLVFLTLFFTVCSNLVGMDPSQAKPAQSLEPLIPKQWQLLYTIKTAEEVKKEQCEYEKRLAELERRLDEFEKEFELKNSKR